jgi:putative peptidoglycan lipid II flippase
MEKLFDKGKKILTSPQTTVLSAATIIMLMIVASRFLGLVRQRVLAHFFVPDDLALFFAAFRLPDTIFEVLVFGTFSSAFIPVFTKALKKGDKKAWDIASTVSNIGFLAFLVLAVIVIIFADSLYGFIAPGFGDAARGQIVSMTRILFAAQGFFVLSYILTAVLESSRRFLVPAIAPLMYNLGIILGTIILAPKLGILGPTLGVVVGASLHFFIQAPLAFRLGFRYSFRTKITKDVVKIGKLALPRIMEVSFMQVAKSVELFLSSLISTASYTYFTFGNTLQLLPVGLFGTSIAKAALPTLSRQTEEIDKFKTTLFNALGQMAFLVFPISAVLIVLRIPIVRLVFGTDIFSWEATVQTGMVVSVFAVGVFFQCATALLARAFYAFHDTKTPVIVSVSALTLNILTNFILIKAFGLPAWGLAASFSASSFVQATALYILIIKKIGNGFSLKPLFKALLASLGAGTVMFFILKFFDRSVWIKRLSFLGGFNGRVTNIPFESFVLDTRYTANLLILTIFTVFLGIATYLLISLILKSKELNYFFSLLKRFWVKKKIGAIPEKESEPVSPMPEETTS